MRNLSLQSAVLTYLEVLDRQGVPAATVKSYRSVLLRLCRAYPRRQLLGLTAKEVGQFLYGPDGILVGKSGNTGIAYRSALRGFFDYGQQQGWARPIAIPKPVVRQRARRGTALPTRLTRGQLQLLVEQADHEMLRGMLAVAMNTAWRISDVLKIRTAEVDFQTGEVYVWIQKTGKFDALPLTLDLQEELRRYLTWYTAETGVTFGGEPAYMFPGWRWRNLDGQGFRLALHPEYPASYVWAHKKLTRLYGALGIQVEPREAWHVIRRSVARIYFDDLRGAMSHDHALRQTAALLGHESTQTTERYLGMEAEVVARNASLRGRRFIALQEPVTVLPASSQYPR